MENFDNVNTSVSTTSNLFFESSSSSQFSAPPISIINTTTLQNPEDTVYNKLISTTTMSIIENITNTTSNLTSKANTSGVVMYPTLKEPDTAVFTVASIYLVCFVVGICGNASTLTVIFGIGKPSVTRRKLSLLTSTSTSDCFRIYVIALCIVDSLVLLSLPWAIVDSLIGFWIFGTTACKIHHLFGSVGRIASTLLITAMSIDRYLCVAYPQHFGRRCAKTTTMVVIALFTLAFIVLLPLLIYAQAQSLVVFQSNHSTAGHLTIRIFKCVDGMPTNLLFWFTGSTFFVGYVCPMIIIALFNTCLLLKIRKHQRKISMRSMIPMKRVTAYIAAIAIFYFACWTPYWTGVIFVSYVDLFESRELRELTNASEKTMLILYCAHIFPYINTAINWFLYGRLASNLSRSRNSTFLHGSNSKNGVFPGSENSPQIKHNNAINNRTCIPLSSSIVDSQNLLNNVEHDINKNGEFLLNQNDRYIPTLRKMTS